MPCGVFWFLHIPKTAGISVENYLRYKAKGWTLYDLYDKKTAKRWQDSPAWHGILKEVMGPNPKVSIHQHASTPGMEYMLQNAVWPIKCILERNGCKLILATILREGPSRAYSEITYQKTPHTKYVEKLIEYANGETKYLLWGIPGNGKTRLFKADHSETVRARKVLSHFHIIGHTKVLPNFFGAMHRVLGQPGNVTVPHSNSGLDKKLDQYKLTEEEKALTRLFNEEDSKLVDTVCSPGRDFCGEAHTDLVCNNSSGLTKDSEANFPADFLTHAKGI